MGAELTCQSCGGPRHTMLGQLCHSCRVLMRERRSTAVCSMGLHDDCDGKLLYHKVVQKRAVAARKPQLHPQYPCQCKCHRKG